MTETSRIETSGIETVTAMFDGLKTRDVDAAVARFDDAIVWHNVGLPTVRGIARVGKFMRLLAKPAYGFDVEIHNIASDGDVVLTERTDALIWRRLRVEFWVCGTFELRDGKIVVWRDYFDNVDFFRGLVKGAFRALVTRRGPTVNGNAERAVHFRSQ